MSEIKRAAVGVVENNGKYLLGKKENKAGHPLSGQWHIPGESVENNETDEQALTRGIFEEAGIKIEVIKFLGSYQTPNGFSANWYLCASNETILIAGSDLQEVKWATLAEIAELNSEVAKSLWPDSVKELFGIQK